MQRLRRRRETAGKVERRLEFEEQGTVKEEEEERARELRRSKERKQASDTHVERRRETGRERDGEGERRGERWGLNSGRETGLHRIHVIDFVRVLGRVDSAEAAVIIMPLLLSSTRLSALSMLVSDSPQSWTSPLARCAFRMRSAEEEIR
eukprot:70936-Hanusia_phi.AAC.3